MLEENLAAVKSSESHGQMEGRPPAWIEQLFIDDIGIGFQFFLQYFGLVFPHQPVEGISITHFLHQVPHFSALLGEGNAEVDQTRRRSVLSFADRYISIQKVTYLWKRVDLKLKGEQTRDQTYQEAINTDGNLYKGKKQKFQKRKVQVKKSIVKEKEWGKRYSPFTTVEESRRQTGYWG